MHFAIDDQGKREWLVWFHGLGAGSEIWQYQIRKFAGDYNILAVDLYNHGKSEEMLCDVDTDNYLEHFSERIREQMEQLAIEKYHFIGFSFGTVIVKHLVACHDMRPESIIMCGAVEQLNLPCRIGYNLVRVLSRVLPYRLMMRVALCIILPFFNQHNIRKWFFTYQWQRREFQCWMKLYREYKQLLLQNEHFYRTGIAKFYIAGTRDYMFYPQVRKVLHNKPHVQVREIPHCGHTVVAEKPQAVYSAIRDFLCPDESAPYVRLAEKR